LRTDPTGRLADMQSTQFDAQLKQRLALKVAE